MSVPREERAPVVIHACKYTGGVYIHMAHNNTFVRHFYTTKKPNNCTRRV